MKINLAYQRVTISRDKIIKKYVKLRKKYVNYISCKNEIYLAIFFSIMIMENYNRPWYLRIIEYLLFIYKKIIYKEIYMTLGIMQIRTKTLIGNIKSIRLADKFIYEEFKNLHVLNTTELIHRIAYKYNPSKLYIEEISKIYDCIK